jgi:hypothetical protein
VKGVKCVKGVEMTDIVHYKVPFGFLGDLANTIFVRRTLRGVFDYRFRQIEELFGAWVNESPDLPSPGSWKYIFRSV